MLLSVFFCQALDVDLEADEDAMLDYLKSKTGARTVPRVFIGGEFFGGSDDVVTAHENGTLAKRLKEVGALKE